MKVLFEYTPLAVLNITKDTTGDEFQKNYLEKIKDDDNNNHKGTHGLVLCQHYSSLLAWF